MEEQVLTLMKIQHKRRISIGQLIKELKFTNKEKMKFFGSIKDFKQLHRTYQRVNYETICFLELNS